MFGWGAVGGRKGCFIANKKNFKMLCMYKDIIITPYFTYILIKKC